MKDDVEEPARAAQLAEVSALAQEVRRFLEPHWARWHSRAGSPPGRRTLSEGTCGRSSTFLAAVMRQRGYAAEAVFGSPVECDCGYHTRDGWRGHGWVRVETPACVVDVTADQFGDAAVIVARPDDPRYREGHDIAGPGWIAERQRAAQELMRLWQHEARIEWSGGSRGETGQREGDNDAT